MAVENVTGATIIVASAAAGLAAPSVSLFGLSMQELALVSGFAVAGAVARAMFDAKEARDSAIKDGVAKDKLPRVDLVSLGYAILAAPFMGSLAYAAIRWAGISTDYAIATIIMGMGYLGREGITLIISAVTGIVKSRLGAK